MRRLIQHLCCGLFLTAALAENSFAQQALVGAWQAGSDFVKVFPCTQVGGDKYIKALKTALPQIPLIAAGGVTQQTAANFILAGAAAIGIGTELIPTEAIELREPERIRELAQRFLGFVNDARQRLAPQKEDGSPAKTDFRKLHRHTPTG
jgi:2-dehydro-3-deoxyphosphogluconate aldolase/(4S)-4-hydroxy-2-oxoglutarate aldolase